MRSFRPIRCLEMGTSVGVSGAYQAAALAKNGRGTLVSLEGHPDIAEQAIRMWNRLCLTRAEVRVGKFAQTFAPTLAEGAVDYAFVDGHHHETWTVQYFRDVAAQAPEGTVLVFDDISWSDGMRRAWRMIVADSQVAEYADLGRLGVVILSAPPLRPG